MTGRLRDTLERDAWIVRAVATVAVVGGFVVAGVLAVRVPGGVFDISLHGATLQSNQASSRDLAEFQKRVRDYVALHKKVEAGIKPLPAEATPEQIDTALQQLSKGISTARGNAKVGDVFDPSMQTWVRQTLQRAFSGPDGKDLRASILDENPIGASVRVNGPYPDSIPLSTMPPKVLEALPKLPDMPEWQEPTWLA